MAWLSVEKIMVSRGGLNIEVLLFSTKTNPVPREDIETPVKIFM